MERLRGGQMYIPAHFREDRVPVLQDAIRKITIATLVTSVDGKMEANHFPMLLASDQGLYGTLYGHMARANSLWQRLLQGGEALAIFLGANTYITPSWYPSKRDTGQVVPTWNYLAGHVHGQISVFDGTEELRDLVGKLPLVHEASRASPWAVTDAPADYIDKMLGAIVGFRLVITELEG